MKAIDIAVVCHEVNAAYCRAIGDNSQPSWWNAPEWQRNSAVKGVELHLANPDLPPSASHEAWMAQKLSEGWAHGPVKDPAATPPTHPCLVPFDQLPKEQKAKDHIFKAVVGALSGFYNEAAKA